MHTSYPKTIFFVALALGLISQSRSQAATTTINFDSDSGGSAIVAPNIFADTTRLTTLYAPLGVTFEGPGGNNGGAILNQAGGFGIQARSGSNFLAFNTNSNAALNDGGFPIPPETILFSSPVTFVSIYAGDDASQIFTMEAFDSGGLSVASDSNTNVPGSYVQLSVSGADIKSVVIQGSSTGGTYVFDDLTFNTIPEPTTLALATLAVLGIGGIRRRK